MQFRDLSHKETQEFKQWAKDNYAPFNIIEDIWHPVVRSECAKINFNHCRNSIMVSIEIYREGLITMNELKLRVSDYLECISIHYR